MKYFQNLNNPNQEYKDLSLKALETLFERNLYQQDNAIFSKVKEIESGVIIHGDAYIKKLTKLYDGVDLDEIQVLPEEVELAKSLLSRDVKMAILQASKNITKFHKRQIPKDMLSQETTPWVSCYREFRAIQKVGLYIPWGSAPLFSTVLMLWIPAKLAGCKEITLCTPPRPDGSIAPEILFCADLLWISQVYKVWGAQAIFALAYGTERIKKVEKIFWPWNAFVTQAKLVISQKVAIDMPAWPSEVLVIADKNANWVFVASDLLSQAEHGTDSQVVLVSESRELIEQVWQEIQRQLEVLPRKEICVVSLSKSLAVLVESMAQAIEVSNLYAPEHLILQCDNWQDYTKQIINAGSVFWWAFTPESVGDYASGTNHTLPTSGFAKTYSWIWVESFWKWITFQTLTQAWLANLKQTVETMALREGLHAHKNAVWVRD